MENSKKYIWSIYIILWVYFLFFDSSFDQSDHIGYYLIFGWIPFAVLHFLWRDKNHQVQPSIAVPDSSKDEPIDERYKLLFKIIEKDDMVKKAAALKETENAITQLSQELKDFYTQTGHDEDYFEKGDQMLDESVEVLEKFWKLRDSLNEMQLYNRLFEKYFNNLDIIDQDLKEGLGVKEAKKKLDVLEKKDGKELIEMQVNVEFSKTLSEEMIEMKREHGDNFRKITINMDDVKKRIYQKHPEWKK